MAMSYTVDSGMQRLYNFGSEVTGSGGDTDLGQEIELVVVLVEFYGFPVLKPHHDAIQKLHAPSRRRDLGSAGACKRAGVCSLEPYL
jgi:hypothetical protein